MKIASEKEKTENFHNYLYYDPILSESDLRIRLIEVWIYPSFSSNEAAKSPFLQTKSNHSAHRNGKFSEFDLKKTLLRCLRAIFGVFFSVLAGKNPPLFLTKEAFLCPISENKSIFYRFSPLPRATGYQRNINEAYRQRRANPPRKKHRLSHTTRIKRRNRRAL